MLAAGATVACILAMSFAPPAQPARALTHTSADTDAGSNADAGDGARTIVVSPAADGRVDPLADAIRAARPGDTIAVRGGTYVGPAGYGARPATAGAPIRLRSAPGERVLIKGTLQLDGADYWQVSGINVTQDPKGPRKEFLVKFDGGRGWRFSDGEIWGTKGVSNLMISGSALDGAPSDYTVSGNCIHDNRASGDVFMNDHEIYLMPGYDAGPGVIEHNLLFGAPNGAAIKAAGPSASTGAARVTIRRNTIAGTAAGVIVGYGTNRVQIRDNLIGDQVIRAPAGARYVRNYDAAVIGNHVAGAANTSVSTVVWGFRHSLRSTADSRRPVRGVLTQWHDPRFHSTSSCSGFHPETRSTRGFGRYS